MADIITARYVIFAFGFLLAVVASFFYSHMLRYEIIGQVGKPYRHSTECSTAVYEMRYDSELLPRYFNDI
jgi:energy-converting hydrogenase Eha subunit A